MSGPPPDWAPRRQILVDADLDLTVDGHPVAIRGRGERVTVAVDSPSTAWQLFQANRPGRRLVRAVTDTLDALGVDVEVTVGGRSVLAAGPSAQAGRIATAVGLDTLEIRPPTEAVWAGVGLAFLAGLAIGAASGRS
ncbi:hypothetical protein [Rubrivirga sp. IMCC45206]|uniref:hypothetical protein n=1 Tax=Rubrivirga sp. IMCC45206 TaxID=3391614 RepID=UPI00398F8EC2